MSFLSNLLTHAVAWGIQSLQWLVVLVGKTLLGVQHVLTWLDSAHPMANFTRPLARFVQRYPKRIVAVLASVLMAAGGGAFAVANLGPDASKLPIVNLTEPVTVSGLEAQAQALDLRDLKLLRSDTTRSADTPESLLRRLGLSDPEAARFLRQNAQARDALSRAGRSVSAEANASQQLTEMTVRWLRNENDDQFQRWVLTRSAQGLSARLETVPMTASIRMSGGTVSSSLYAASDEARLPDNVVSQLADIFSSQIDFHKALRKGARFAVVYEVLEADGEPLRAGKVLSAEFINGNKTYEAVWFQEPGKKATITPLTAAACAAPTSPRLCRSRARPAASACACTRSSRPCKPTAAWTTLHRQAPPPTRWATAWSTSPACKAALAMSSSCATATATARSTPT